MSPFVCHRCGACCRWPGSVLMTDSDLSAAAKALGISETAFVEAHTVLARNRAQLSLKEAEDGSCEFLGSDGECRIYSARPQQCREFPSAWHVEGCPGLSDE